MSARAGACALAAALAGTCAAPASAELAVSGGGCSWPVKADPDLVNVAFPDEGARYWGAPFVATPDGAPVRMRIRGRFPLARYMSFHVYSGGTPVDALADTEIVPSEGGNPFVAGADRSDRGTYELQVVLGPRPADPEPNTLYASGTAGEPNPAGSLLYRIYLPEGDEHGSAALPEIRVTLDGPDADVRLPLESCPEPRGESLLNRVLRDASLPASANAAETTRPDWGVARSNAISPFFPNLHNTYLSLLVLRNAGDVVAFRAKAPTFPNTRGASTMGDGQLRYWSVCANDGPTTRYVSCIADEDV